MSSPRLHPVRALVHAWLTIDFFGDARRTGAAASTLTTTVFSQSFLALVVAALLYPEPPPVPFAAANLSLSTLLVALGAFDSEPPAHRRTADRHLLATSPLPRLPALIARTLHAAFGTMLVTVGMALPPAILLACRQGDPLLAPAYVAMACLCAGLAIGGLSAVLRLLRRLLGGHATALAAGTGKALLLAAGVVTFALSLPALQRNADALPFGRLGANALPPYHAAKWLAAPIDGAPHLLVLLLLGALLLLAALAIGDGERERTAGVGGEGPVARLLLRLAGDRASGGLAVFTATMLWRSPLVRARVLPLLGVPAGIAFLAWGASDARGRGLFTSMALQFPAIYLPFVIGLLPQGDQQGTRWLFDTAPPIDRRRVQRAVWLALTLRVLLPIHCAALAVLLLAATPIGRALPLSLFSFASGAAVARAMVRTLDALPFSRDEPGAAIEFGDLLAFALLLAGAGAAVALASRPVQWAAVACAIAVLGVLARPPRPAAGLPAQEFLTAATAPPAPAAPTRLPKVAPQSLRRELAAVGTLYTIQSTLPLLIGLAFAR